MRVVEAVPGRVVAGAPKPVGAGEIDDDGVRGRDECGRALVVEAAEDEVGMRRQRLVVRHEVGQLEPVGGAGRACPPAFPRGSRTRAQRSRAWVARTRSSVSWPE